MVNESTIPVIECVVSPVGRVARFKCPHCNGWHMHGIPADETNPTARANHCWTRQGQAAYPQGYMLSWTIGVPFKRHDADAPPASPRQRWT